MVKLRVWNNTNDPITLQGFNIAWPDPANYNAEGILRLQRVVIGGVDADDWGQPGSEGQRLWEGDDTTPDTAHDDPSTTFWETNYVLPANTIRPVYLDFAGTETNLRDAFGIHIGDFVRMGPSTIFQWGCESSMVTPAPCNNSSGGMPSAFYSNGVVQLDIQNFSFESVSIDYFEIDWPNPADFNADGVLRLQRIVVGGENADDWGQPDSGGQRLWEGDDPSPQTADDDASTTFFNPDIVIPSLSTAPVYLDFAGTDSDLNTAFGIEASDFSWSWLSFVCVEVEPSPTPSPTHTPTPTSTLTPTPTPTDTMTPTDHPSPTATRSVTATETPSDHATNLRIEGVLDVAPVLPTFHWRYQSAQPIDWQHLYVIADDGTVIINEWYQSQNICTGDDCIVTPDSILPGYGLSNGSYQWWVGVYNPPSVIYSGGPDFTPATFAVNVPALALNEANFAATEDGLRLLLTWDDMPNMLWYHIGVASDGYSTRGWYAGEDVCADGACRLLLDVPAGSYSAWMQAWGPNGYASGPLANGWIEAAGTPVRIGNTADGTGLPTNVTFGGGALTWTSGANATYYEVYITTTDYSEVYSLGWSSNIALGCNAPGATCTLPLDVTLVDGTAYKIYIQTWGPNGLATGGLTNAPSFIEAEVIYMP